jgi:cytochrome oxidase Cu insertion factor (SCO1/SenC/PrrC family)
MKKGLIGILVAGAIGLAGCNNHQKYCPQFAFTGYIDGKKITYYLANQGHYNIIEETTDDKNWKIYLDSDNDSKLDFLEETIDGVTKKYSFTTADPKFLEEAQKKFDEYVKKIERTKNSSYLK